MRIAAMLLALMLASCSLINTGTDEPPPRLVPLQDLRDVRAARQELIGKSLPEIQSLVGSPDRQAGNAEREWWTYEDRFRDPITNRRVPVVTFYFVKGKLEAVTF